jgi:hypothetical protein
MLVNQVILRFDAALDRVELMEVLFDDWLLGNAQWFFLTYLSIYLFPLSILTEFNRYIT